MARKKAPKPPAEHTRTFGCALCPDGTAPFEGAPAYGAHVREQHPELLNADGKLVGSRHGKLFLDGEGFYANQYEWKQGGRVICTEAAEGPRDKW